jgi:nitroreductase
MPRNLDRNAVADHPIHELIAARYSPYDFEPRSVERATLCSCLEAARWAASSFNEQPWSFILATRDQTESFDRMLMCLMEANREWASRAGALFVSVVNRTFSRNDKPNRVADHDMGLAVAALSFQATELGLCVHEMAGLDLDAARQTYGIQPPHDPLTAVAIGHPADPNRPDAGPMAERDRQPRTRKALSAFVFSGSHGQPADELWA